MWPLNSQNIPNINNLSQKPLPIDQSKNNISEQVPLYQTPIKQSLNIQRTNDTPPLQFDFNFYFGNLWSSGHIPAQHVDVSMNNSVTQHNREANMLLFKSSMEKSGYKLTPMSEVKNINNSNIIEYGLNNIYPNGLNNIYENELNQNEFTKKNLTELFNNAKNDEFLPSNKKINNNLDNNINNTNNYINNNNIYFPNTGNNFSIIPNSKINLNMNNNSNNKIIAYVDWENDNKENNNPNKENNNTNNKNSIINEKSDEMFNSPINKKPKKIFECSGSSITTNSSKSSARKRRFRKNNEQILLLSQFFNEHKHWSKNQIKEISNRTGLKENKVYKWLWDQRNKEYKATKFIINKKNPP